MIKKISSVIFISAFSLSSLSSLSSFANEYEMISQVFPVYDFEGCYYKGTESLNSKRLPLKGMLGTKVPETTSDGEYVLQDTSRVVDGWSSAYWSCDSVMDTLQTLDISNHVPNVNLTVSQDIAWEGGQTRLVFRANASDYESNITWYEWKVNGVVQNTVGATLIRPDADGRQLNVSVKAWDDGIKVYNSSEKYYYNDGFPVLPTYGEDSVSVTVKPWVGCGRDCIIH